MKRLEPRSYLLLVVGHIVSTFGSSIYLIALVVYLAELTDSAAVLGSVQFAAYLPAALFGPLAGALVDRWDRKRIVVWTDLARGLVMLAAAASAMVWGSIPLAVIFLVTVVVSGSGVLFVPAVHSLVPDLVPARKLKQANSFRSAATQAANLAGSAVGAAFYVLLGAPALFAFNGVSFLISGLTEVPIRTVRQKPATHPPLLSSIAEGFRIFKTQKGIRALVAVQAATNLLLPPIVVSLPFVLRDVWGIPQAFFGLYFAAVLAGSVLAFGVLSLRWITRRREAVAYRVALPVITLFMGSLALLTAPGLARSPSVQWILFPLFMVAGGAIGTLHLVGVTRLQQIVRPDNRGRVFAAAEAVTAALLPAVYVFSGVAAELLRDIPAALYGGVAVVAAGVTVATVRSRALRSILQDGAPARNEKTTAGAR